jgi:hypothetical protein
MPVHRYHSTQARVRSGLQAEVKTETLSGPCLHVCSQLSCHVTDMLTGMTINSSLTPAPAAPLRWTDQPTLLPQWQP